jgi:hypothetical protein
MGADLGGTIDIVKMAVRAPDTPDGTKREYSLP